MATATVSTDEFMHAGGADDGGTVSTDEFANAGAPSKAKGLSNANAGLDNGRAARLAAAPKDVQDVLWRMDRGAASHLAPLPDTGLTGMVLGAAAEGFGNIGTGIESLGRTIARNNVIPGMGAVPQPIPQPAPAPYTPIAQPLVDWGQHEMDLSNSSTIPRFGAYLAGQALPYMAAMAAVPEALLPEAGGGLGAAVGRGAIENFVGSGATAPQGHRLPAAITGGMIGGGASGITRMLTPARPPSEMGQRMPLTPPESPEVSQANQAPSLQSDALKTAPVSPQDSGLTAWPEPTVQPIDITGRQPFLRDAQGNPIPNPQPLISTKGVQPTNGQETAPQGNIEESAGPRAAAQGADQRAQDTGGNGENPAAVPNQEADVLTTDQFANLGSPEEARAPAIDENNIPDNVLTTQGAEATPPRREANVINIAADNLGDDAPNIIDPPSPYYRDRWDEQGVQELTPDHLIRENFLNNEAAYETKLKNLQNEWAIASDSRKAKINEEIMECVREHHHRLQDYDAYLSARRKQSWEAAYEDVHGHPRPPLDKYQGAGPEKVFTQDEKDNFFSEGKSAPPESQATPPQQVRLYRADTNDGNDAPVPDWMKGNPDFKGIQDATGRWFYGTPQEAQQHLEKFGGKGIVSVDVPADQLENYRASNQPQIMEGRHANPESAKTEFFVPREIAQQSKPQPQATAASGTMPAEPPPSPAAATEPAEPTLPPGIVSKSVITNPRTGEVMGHQFDVNPEKPESAVLPNGKPVGGFTTGPNPTTEDIWNAYNAKRAQFKLSPVKQTPQENPNEQPPAPSGAPGINENLEQTETPSGGRIGSDVVPESTATGNQGNAVKEAEQVAPPHEPPKGEAQPGPEAEQPAVSLRKGDIDADRERIGLNRIDGLEKKNLVAANTKAKVLDLKSKASDVAQDVLQNDHRMTIEEVAGAGQRITDINHRRIFLQDRIDNKATDPPQRAFDVGEMQKNQEEADSIWQAVRKSGRASGQENAIKAAAWDSEGNLTEQLAMAREAKGSDLTPKETEFFKKAIAERDATIAKHEAEIQRLNDKQAAQTVAERKASSRNRPVAKSYDESYAKVRDLLRSGCGRAL